MAATDERAIHEFPTGTIDDNSLLIMDRPTSSPGEYETEKFAIVNLGLKLLGGIDFPSNLDTEEQDIFGAINEVTAKAMNIAAEYDETASYSKGDYCIYQNAAYRCVKASGTTTGTFVAADWTQIKVLEEVKTNTDEITLKQNSTDNTLATTDKTIVGAINELKSGKADTDYIKIIGQSTFTSPVNINANTEYNSSTPVAITGIPSGYKVVSITNIRCWGYYGSRVVCYAWLSDSTHYHYSLFNPTNLSQLTCQLDISFLCVKE